MKLRRVLLPLLLLLAPCVPTAAGPPDEKAEALWARLRARIEAVDRSLEGVLGVAVRDLESGAAIELRANTVFPQASSIKLAILYELYRQAEEGRVDLEQVLTPPLPRVAGSGVLQLLSGRVSLTVRDLAVLMFGWSDNEATNLLIDRVSLDAVNRRLRELGLARTTLARRMMDLEAAQAGRENLSTPAEMRALLETLHSGRGLSPERARDLLAVAATPKDSALRQPLPPGLRVADKPGALEGVRCASGLVYLPGRPYAIAVMTTYLRRDADGEKAIAEISAAVYETIDRLARGAPHGRVVSEK
jgi:beta-lactamase class A